MPTLRENLDESRFVTNINDKHIDEYITDLYNNSIWAEGKTCDTKRHFEDMIEQHLVHVISKNNIDLKGHLYGRFNREINEYVNATDEKTKQRKLNAAAFNVAYDIVRSGDLELTLDDVTQIILGKLSLVGAPSCLSECYECGEQLAFELCGTTLTLANDQCEPVGYYETKVVFPTGKIIMQDCIGEVHEIIERNNQIDTENYGMESAASHRDISAMFARGGMYHVFVGNSCPGVYLDRTSDVITIGNNGFDEETDEVSDPIDGEHLDNICTDLWWASIMDIKTFKKTLKAEHGWKKGSKIYKEALASHWYDVYEIPAGTYIGKSYHHKDGYPDQWSNKHVMATLTKVD